MGRDLDYRVEHERVKSYDEKKFAQDPTGQDGGLDRMLYNLWMQRYLQYVDNLAHIFNTGEANSPVWENTDYIEHLYGQLLKKQYLKTASESSMVLSYDWSEGGDVEVVIEDIERLNMDYHDKYDKQQKDWRLLTEDGFASKRQAYTNKNKLINQFRDPFWSADKLILTSTEGTELERLKLRLPGNQFRYGYNTVLGDPEPFFSFAFSRPNWYKDVKYSVENTIGDRDMEHEERLRLARKEAGMVDWWKV